MKIVATTSLPAVDRLNADRWNAARSRQNVFFQDTSVQFISLDTLSIRQEENGDDEMIAMLETQLENIDDPATWKIVFGNKYKHF